MFKKYNIRDVRGVFNGISIARHLWHRKTLCFALQTFGSGGRENVPEVGTEGFCSSRKLTATNELLLFLQITLILHSVCFGDNEKQKLLRSFY